VFLPDATAEVVYLDRGVAFTLAESSENDVRIGIARIFPADDTQGWITRLGGADQPGPSHPQIP